MTNSELFKNLSELELENQYFDLHNDYHCFLIKYFKNELILSFKSSKTNVITPYLDIIFEEVVINKMTIELENCSDLMTIDNLYRGRFEVEKDVLKESTVDGKYYYYLEFYNGHAYEVFANKLIVEY